MGRGAGRAQAGAGRRRRGAGRAGDKRGCAARRAGSRRAGGRHAGTRGARDRGAAAGAGRTAWVLGSRPVRTGWASWVLMHPAWFFDLVFDLVMFLSHRLNPVHEHCSSQNFPKKKNLSN